MVGQRKAAEFQKDETLRYTAREAPKGRDPLARGINSPGNNMDKVDKLAATVDKVTASVDKVTANVEKLSEGFGELSEVVLHHEDAHIVTAGMISKRVARTCSLSPRLLVVAGDKPQSYKTILRYVRIVNEM